MAGGGDQQIQKERNHDGSSESSDESSDEGDMEEMVEDFERRLDGENRKRQLQLELNRRKAGHESFAHHFNKMWDDIMKPIPVSDTSSSEEESETTSSEKEPWQRESSGEGANNLRSNEQHNASNNAISGYSSEEYDVVQKEKMKIRKGEKRKYSNSERTKESSERSQCNIHDGKPSESESKKSSQDGKTNPLVASDTHNASRGVKMYRHSTALLMFKWARNQPEFHEEKERVGYQVTQTDEIIERKAFIKFFEKKNKEEKRKLDQENQRRAKEWRMEKRRKRDELKSKDAYNAWVDKENPRRIKRYQKKRRRDVRELRKLYLDGQEDIKFEKFSEPPSA